MSLLSWKGVKKLFSSSGEGGRPSEGGTASTSAASGADAGGDATAHAEAQNFWIDDKKCKNCYECDQPFTLWIRRHHCRKCGKVFCSKCASNSIPSKEGDQVRVCNYCYQLYLERPETYGKFRPANKRMSMSHRLTASTVEAALGQGPQKQEAEERRAGDRAAAAAAVMESNELAGSHSGSFTQRQTSPLAINRDKSSGSAATSSKSARDEEGDVAVAGSYVAESHHSHSAFNELYGSSSSTAQFGSMAAAEGTPGTPLPPIMAPRLGGEDGDGEIGKGTWAIPARVLDLTADIGENSLQVKLFRYLQKLGGEFESLASNHLRGIIRTLLEAEEIERREDWLDILADAATSAAANIDRLEMPGNAPQDPRDYVKVKRVGSGEPSDSYLVKGLVFSKNIAHRRMPNDIRAPKILLLGCAVEYQRMQNRLSSLDILLEQEREHLRLSVARILQFRPTLIFVEKTVARNAQELLLQAGVTLVLKVKPSLMDHISRLTGSHIVQNLADIRPENFGTCDHFYVKTFKVTAGDLGSNPGTKQGRTKTLLFLDGCPYKAGCSIVLKGAPLSQLVLLKRIVSFAIYAAYHHKIECKFLPLQCVSAWNPHSMCTSDKLVRRLRESYEKVRQRNRGSEISISPFMVTRAGGKGGNVEYGTAPQRPSSDIARHQHFFVSLASRCPARGLLCEAPSVHDIAFYETTDVSLVRFLRAALPEPNRHCPHPRCGDGPADHIRAYVSGDRCVTLTVKELREEDALPGKDSNVIWAWRQGPNETPEDCVRVPMTLDAGQISLGLFLQYFFSAPTLKGPDGHRLNSDYACYFGIGNGVARFTCERIRPLGVHLPPTPMSYDEHVDEAWLVQEGNEVLLFCEDILGRIDNMVGRVKHKLKAAGRTEEEELAGLRALEDGVRSERAKLQALVSPKSRSVTEFGEVTTLKVFEMNKVRRQMVLFASSCISMAININDGISVQAAAPAPGHSRQRSLLGGWFDQNGSGDQGSGGPRVVTSPTKKSETSLGAASADLPALSVLIGAGSSAPAQSLKKSATDPSPQHHQFAQLNTSALSWNGRFTLPQGEGERVVAVYDDEPTSLIGYVLMSTQYRKRLEELVAEASVASAATAVAEEDGDVEVEGGPAPRREGSGGWGRVRELILSEEATHIRHSFEDLAKDGVSKVQFQVTVYYATQFQETRRLFGKGDETFIHSLLRCRKWETKGGKSNAYFAKTLDDRFVVKQMSKTEISSFLTFAPSYFQYMSDRLEGGGEESCLAKIFGVYQVVIKHPSSAGGAGKDVRLDVMIMENIFYAKAITRIYDLKGSIRSRYNAEPNSSNAVLLDENLLEILPASPILVRQESRAKLERSLWKDTSFLAKLGVMDYSLLVGIDEVNGQLVVGIIDYIRQYTWDKQLETWVKSSGILGGAGKVPTIISPKQYMKRFRIAMMVYFTLVPSEDPPEKSLDPEAM